jgi:hypothetical protein
MISNKLFTSAYSFRTFIFLTRLQFLISCALYGQLKIHPSRDITRCVLSTLWGLRSSEVQEQQRIIAAAQTDPAKVVLERVGYSLEDT